MTKSPFLFSVAAVLLTACQAGDKSAADSGANSAATVDTAADETAIRAQVTRWMELVKAKDAAAIAQLYTEDGAVMPPNGPIGKGRDAIQKTWTSLVETPGFSLDIVPEQIVVSSSGDMALDRGTYSLALAPNGAAVNDKGKYVVVWRKVGGEWKAAADIFNSDLPASGG